VVIAALSAGLVGIAFDDKGTLASLSFFVAIAIFLFVPVQAVARERERAGLARVVRICGHAGVRRIIAANPASEDARERVPPMRGHAPWRASRGGSLAPLPEAMLELSRSDCARDLIWEGSG
jgi:hypothetical protein